MMADALHCQSGTCCGSGFGGLILRLSQARLRSHPSQNHPTMDESTILFQNSLDRLKQGDSTASGELISSVSRRLIVLAHRMLRDGARVSQSEQSDDVLQQAAIRLQVRLADVVAKTPQDFLRLAASQVRRELMDLARHDFSHSGSGANHADTSPGTDNANSSTVDIEVETTCCNPQQLAVWTNFHQAVELLPEVEQRVVDLLWYHELSPAAAAEILQVPERQVRRYWQTARLALQKKVGSFF